MMAHKHKGLISQHSLQSNSAHKKRFTSRLNDQQLWNSNINKVFILTFQWTTGLNVITAWNSKSNKPVIYVNVSIWINEWNPPANLEEGSITWHEHCDSCQVCFGDKLKTRRGWSMSHLSRGGSRSVLIGEPGWGRLFCWRAHTTQEKKKTNPLFRQGLNGS